MGKIYKVAFFYLFILVSSFSQAAQEAGQPVCFKNGDQFEQNKNSLPAHFQNPPLVFTHDGRNSLMPVAAAVKILITNEKKFKLVAHTWTPLNINSEELYIESICYQNQEFTVTLENGESYDIETNSENKSVEIKNLEFQKSTESQFAGIVEKINQEQKQKETPSNNEHSTNR